MSEVADYPSIREELRTLVDHIPGRDAPAVRKMLRAFIDPLELKLLLAPLDDEPISEHEEEALQASEERRQRGELPLSHEQVLRELGITESDLL
ncbi:MAG: hypothetical protein M3Y07_04700 [Acidobacteriota bacterium]|nr:hypothetical protein [Acidobacteriota bacterium]